MLKLIIITILFIVLSFVYESVLLAKCGVAVILVMCLLLGRKERYLTNPYFLFLLCPLSLLLYFNLGPMFMLDLTVDTINLGTINMLAFVSALYYFPGVGKHDFNITLTGVKSLEFHAVFFWLLSILGRFIPALASILWIFIVPAIVCALKTKKKIMLLFVGAIFLLSVMSGHLSKTTVLTYCVVFLICFEKYYIKTFKERRKVIVMMFAAGALMVASFSFANKERGEYDAEEGIAYYESQGMKWDYDAKYFMPYMYLTNGWTNLQYVTERNYNPSDGLWIAKPFLGYLKLDDDMTYRVESFSNFNTPTYIACGYLDFGYWGSMIVSILLGIFVKFVYSRFRYSKSPFDVSSYVLVALGTFEMFFSNHFLMQSYPITCVILMELYKYLVVRRPTYEPQLPLLK